MTLHCRKINYIFHLVMILATMGVWVFVLPAVFLIGGCGGWTCSKCGRGVMSWRNIQATIGTINFKNVLKFVVGIPLAVVALFFTIVFFIVGGTVRKDIKRSRGIDDKP
jgi:hypothetical protein